MSTEPKYHPFDTAQLVQSNQIENCALRYRHFLEVKKEGAKYKFNFQRPSQKFDELIEQLRERQTQQLLQFSNQISNR